MYRSCCNAVAGHTRHSSRCRKHIRPTKNKSALRKASPLSSRCCRVGATGSSEFLQTPHLHQFCVSNWTRLEQLDLVNHRLVAVSPTSNRSGRCVICVAKKTVVSRTRINSNLCIKLRRIFPLGLGSRSSLVPSSPQSCGPPGQVQQYTQVIL